MVAVVAAYERSGLTRRSFSEQAGLAVSTLDYWRREVRDGNGNGNGPRIVPVTLAGWESRARWESGFQLSLANGVRIECGWEFPEEGMARLLGVVGGR